MAATAKNARGTTAKIVRENPLAPFVWKATDKRGVVMKGEMAAKSANFVKAELRKQGLNPQEVKPKPKPLFGSAGKTVSAQEVTFFSRQIATMMQSGVPMVQAIEILANGQKNPRFGEMLNSLRDEVAGGVAFSEALKSHPAQFNDLYRNLVKAGEGAGVLDTVLDNLATYLERIQVIKGKIKKAMFYPASVLAVGLLVSLILLLFVIPQFEKTFQGFGADLPAFTMFYIKLSQFTVSNWWWMLGGVIGIGFFLASTYKRSEAVKDLVDRTLLKLPVIGDVMHKSAVSRFARTLGLTFRAGVPLVEALETVSGATGSRIYDQAVKRIQTDVAVGFPLNMAMKQVNLFPHMVVQMTAIGEEAGALDSMLFKVADFFEQEVDNAVDAMTSLMEPFIIVVLGTIVGGMVVAMYLPIFKLGEVVG